MLKNVVLKVLCLPSLVAKSASISNLRSTHEAQRRHNIGSNIKMYDEQSKFDP